MGAAGGRAGRGRHRAGHAQRCIAHAHDCYPASLASMRTWKVGRTWAQHALQKSIVPQPCSSGVCACVWRRPCALAPSCSGAPSTPAVPAPSPLLPQDAPAAELPTAVPAAAHVVAEFVRSPDVFQFDLATNPAVAQLSSVKEHAPLHRLLSIFLKGSVQVRLCARRPGAPGQPASLRGAGKHDNRFQWRRWMGLRLSATGVSFRRFVARQRSAGAQQARRCPPGIRRSCADGAASPAGRLAACALPDSHRPVARLSPPSLPSSPHRITRRLSPPPTAPPRWPPQASAGRRPWRKCGCWHSWAWRMGPLKSPLARSRHVARVLAAAARLGQLRAWDGCVRGLLCSRGACRAARRLAGRARMRGGSMPWPVGCSACQLPATHPHAYQPTRPPSCKLQAALDLSAEEVEGAVVQAIGKRIAEARIDQLR